MLIEAPFTISITESQSLSRSELQLTFTQEFRAMSQTQRVGRWDEYIQELKRESAKLAESDADRQGMLTLLQIIEPMREHIAEDALDLEQTLEIAIDAAEGMH